ncbi:MAG: hypothetical protein IT444_06920 [Phycisphaeraceae bacterium]|nr:hypothetical protein [Phycisphaeraceae bacterium]
MKHIARLVVAVTLFTALMVQPAFAQLSRLDKNTLVDGLRREKMGELLKHLAETDPQFKTDKMFASNVLIAQLMLDYTIKGTAAGQEPDPVKAAELRQEALDAFTQALDARRKLIADFRDNDQRPIFQTQLAEQILFDGLQNEQFAAEFYDVGVPTQAQRDRFEKLVAEALVSLTDADLRFFYLQGQLPKEKDHVDKRVNTGLWDRMINDYYKLRTQLFLAQAAYYTALLPDSHPYYQNLGKDPLIGAVQKKTPAEERARLLALVVERSQPFIDDKSDKFEIRRESMSIVARALVQAGKTAEATAMLDELLAPSTEQNDLINLVLTAKKSQLLDATKQSDAAIQLLHDRALRPPAGNSPTGLLFRLLLVDAEHRILRRAAEAAPPDKRMAEMDRAYRVYLRFLDDPAIGENKEPLRMYIYRRWEANIPAGADLTSLPPVVVGSVAEMARLAGADLLAEGKPEEAQKKFERSVEVANKLLERKQLDPAVEANALYSKAYATYVLNQSNDLKKLEVIGIITDMAERFPRQPLSESAIGSDAVPLARYMFEQENHPSATGEVYDKAMKVLLKNYGVSKAADDQRLPYAELILLPQGRYVEVADVLKGVPRTHPDYFPSQRLRVFSMLQVWREAVKPQPESTQPPAPVEGQTAVAPPKPEELAKATTEAALQLMQEADAALAGAQDQETRKRILQAAGWSRLVLFDVSVEADKDIPKGLEYFRDFDRIFATDKELISQMLQRRITAYLNIDRIDDAVSEASYMFDNFPDAAAPVVEQVVAKLDTQMDTLRREAAATNVDRIREEKTAQRKARADAAVKMSELLLTWAKDPKKGLTPEQILPAQLTYVKSLLMAGRPGEALTIVTPLEKQFPKEARAILYKSDAIFDSGDKSRLVEAARGYSMIVKDIKPDKGGVYPPIWWGAMLRRLQINLKLEENVEDVPVRIQALRLRDPNLGGDLFKNDYETLDANAKRWISAHPGKK